MLNWFDYLFMFLRRNSLVYRFILFTRILLAAGFIPTGLVKLLGERFTTITTDNPIGAFFEAMYQTGMYWQFLGLMQVVAGIFLLIPATAHLGAAIFWPIILNIFVITIALGFTGTPIITGLMLLAVTSLCIWDYHRFRSLLTVNHRSFDLYRHCLDWIEWISFFIFALCIVLFFLLSRNFAPQSFGMICVLVGLSAGLLAIGRYIWQIVISKKIQLVY